MCRTPDSPCGRPAWNSGGIHAAPQPNIGGYEALVGSDHKDLIFQALVLVLLHIPALVEITAVCPGEVGGVIDYHSPLTFEELIHFQVCLCIDRVA